MASETKMTRNEFNRKAKIAALSKFSLWPSNQVLSRCYNIYSNLHDKGIEVSVEFEGREIFIK